MKDMEKDSWPQRVSGKLSDDSGGEDRVYSRGYHKTVEERPLRNSRTHPLCGKAQGKPYTSLCQDEISKISQIIFISINSVFFFCNQGNINQTGLFINFEVVIKDLSFAAPNGSKL